MLSIGKISITVAGWLAVAIVGGCATSGLTRLETRPGVTVRVDTFIPETSTASILILRGRFGNITDYKYFPLTTVSTFNRADIAVAVMDAPSNRKGLSRGGPVNRSMLRLADRSSNGHKTDLKKTIAFLKRKSGKPVWVFGVSMGSVSAAVAGILGGPDLAGVILMSSVTAIHKDVYASDNPIARAILTRPSIDKTVLDLAVEKIVAPTLVVRHEKDGCTGSDPAGGPKIMARLTNAPKTEMLTYSGGYQSGDVCGVNAYHLFAGLTSEVTDAIIKFIKANSK